jgi:hypothetical protein
MIMKTIKALFVFSMVSLFCMPSYLSADDFWDLKPAKSAEKDKQKETSDDIWKLDPGNEPASKAKQGTPKSEEDFWSGDGNTSLDSYMKDREEVRLEEERKRLEAERIAAEERERKRLEEERRAEQKRLEEKRLAERERERKRRKKEKLAEKKRKLKERWAREDEESDRLARESLMNTLNNSASDINRTAEKARRETEAARRKYDQARRDKERQEELEKKRKRNERIARQKEADRAEDRAREQRLARQREIERKQRIAREQELARKKEIERTQRIATQKREREQKKEQQRQEMIAIEKAFLARVKNSLRLKAKECIDNKTYVIAGKLPSRKGLLRSIIHVDFKVSAPGGHPYEFGTLTNVTGLSTGCNGDRTLIGMPGLDPETLNVQVIKAYFQGR